MRITKSQKKQLNLALKKLSEVLTSANASDSIKVLASELDSLEISSENVSTDDFHLSDELTNNFEWLCFSDGACRGNPGPGAWGSIMQDVKSKVVYEASGVEVPTTNNRMELQGAIEVLKFLLDEDAFKESDRVVLFSDSKYVVDGITTWVTGWKKRGWRKADKKAPENVELWQELDSVRDEFNSITFKWVKGHSGHPQNEYCDQLANKALDEAGF